jgi:pimeloyl-ACP methyl ester carboxylesterase
VRARLPDRDGYAERAGVKVFYEVFEPSEGPTEPTLLLLPTWSIVHSRHWKAQVPYLSRHFRVVTFDGRGNGRSDRPPDGAAYTMPEFADDAIAVMDAVGVECAVVVGLSLGASIALILAAAYPERVGGLAFVAPTTPFGPRIDRPSHGFDEVADAYEGWARYNRHSWRQDYRGFLDFFWSQGFTEPHSTKQIEDCVSWATEIGPEGLILTAEGEDHADSLAPAITGGRPLVELCADVHCPVLVIGGEDDAVAGYGKAVDLAERTNGMLVTLEGSGHFPHARDPVQVNLLLRQFTESLHSPASPARRWARGKSRRKHALYISSPIGLGHAQRDVAIAHELRKLHPDLEIDWLAQHPVTAVLEANGERIHPASAWLANESRHIESESAEHDLHCFQAWRRMDEILVANFMVFHDVVSEELYDLWIGDEAWELDYFLHENPEQKRAAYCWLTDFVGWLPMADGGEHEAYLAADYNAEMIEHIARYPRLRDRAIFVGNPDDIVPDSFGADLPLIRDWTEEHFDFAGYVTGFDPAELADREALRDELGYRPSEQVCVVAVGGSGVGGHLLRRVIAAYPEAKARVPALRMIVVAGPRIDPDSLPGHDGLEIRGYVHHLYRHLAACDLAVVQGGLTTTMELTANRRPFLYFPLGHHFEQNFHVRHRLGRYGAGLCMDFATATPDVIAVAIADEIGRPVEYRQVETDGAARAAARIAEML